MVVIKFANVLEEVVVKEVHVQIEELRPEVQPKVKVAEVTAYALNRLPPLFATSMAGWKYQYDYALNELEPQISQLVKRGIKTSLFGDPLHDITPLPNQLFMTNAGVLYQLSQLLGRKYLRWRDVPVVIKEIASKSSCLSQIDSSQDQTVLQSTGELEIKDSNDLSYRQRTLLSGSKGFMARQLAKKKQDALKLSESAVCLNQVYGNSWANDKKAKDAIEMEYRALESYTLQAQLGLINVLEHLVLRAIERITTPELYAQINLNEVAAYALNRLPPMYATSERGFKYLRQKAITEFPRELIGSVRNGVMKVHQVNHVELQPIYANQFVEEYEQAMRTLNSFFNRDDVSLENIVAIAQELMTCHAGQSS